MTEQITDSLFRRKYETLLLTLLFSLTDLPGSNVWDRTSPDRMCDFFRALKMWLCTAEQKTKTQRVTLEFPRPPGHFHFQPSTLTDCNGSCRPQPLWMRIFQLGIQADIRTHYVLMESGKLCMLLKQKTESIVSETAGKTYLCGESSSYSQSSAEVIQNELLGSVAECSGVFKLTSIVSTPPPK